VYNAVTLPICSGWKVNLKLVQIAQECESLSIEEAKILIQHLKTLIDSEELSSVSKSSWRKREIAERFAREEYQND
jgi:Mg/Co/Ni transporter MgtE